MDKNEFKQFLIIFAIGLGIIGMGLGIAALYALFTIPNESIGNIIIEVMVSLAGFSVFGVCIYFLLSKEPPIHSPSAKVSLGVK